ncbi:MAG TPA: MlaD family protein [Chitinispirillaceae bacterium]|nr:MlaD family protein [Chitinispirillaceae bacterium]
MKKTNVDLVVGGSILISLIILIGGVLWLKDVSVSAKMVSYTILFPNVGTLQIGDPVKINGVSKGAVSDIYLRSNGVAVVIETERSVILTDSCKFSVQNIGIMGERGIGIQYSDKGMVVKANTKSDTCFFLGIFDPGIAEAMSMMGVVLAEVETLVGNVSTIIETTVGDTAFVSIFKTLVNRLDTISNVAQTLLSENKPAIDRSLKNLQTISSDLKGVVARNSGHIDAIMNNGDSLSAAALSIASQVDTLTVSLNEIINQVKNGEGSLGMFVKDSGFYNEIKRTVGNLDTLINEVQGDALKLRIKLGFGKKKK